MFQFELRTVFSIQDRDSPNWWKSPPINSCNF